MRLERNTVHTPISRVLLVDDNADAADMVSELLNFHQIENRVAYDGESALAMLANWPADIVFLDIQMPRMNGYETAIAMHALPGCAELPIVAWSGWDGCNDQETIAQARMACHLTKPTTIETLITLICKFEETNRL